MKNKRSFLYFLKNVYLKGVIPLCVIVAGGTAAIMYFCKAFRVVGYINFLFVESIVFLILSAIFFTAGSRNVYSYYSASKGTQFWGFETKNEVKDDNSRKGVAIFFLSVFITLFVFLLVIYLFL